MKGAETPLSTSVQTDSGIDPSLVTKAHLNSSGLVWLIPVAVLLFDQVTKWIVAHTMHLHESFRVIGNWIRLTYILNPGGAFGIRWGHVSVYYLAAFLVIGWITWHLWKQGGNGRLSTLALALVLGGAIGNLIDRLVRGQVVDFIDVEFPDMHIPAFDIGFIRHPGLTMDRWPTFNFADSAVTVGVICLLVTLWFDPDLFSHRRKQAESLNHSAPAEN